MAAATAREHAKWKADDRRKRKRRKAEDRRVGSALTDESRDRPLESHRLAEVESETAGEPVNILFPKRAIDPEPVAFRGKNRRLGAEGIAGRREVSEQKRCGRHREDEQRGKPGAPEQVPSDAAVHDPVFRLE
jgi:hypothetical protein